MVSSSSALQDDALLHCPTIPLRNGMKHPAIGFGTYKVGFMPASASEAVTTSSAVAAGGPDPIKTERTARECVLDALQTGYRFLECAEFYGNEAAVGQAIVDSQIPREELFLCSKVWTTTIEKGPDSIRAQLERTLRDLQTDYLDLYLVHWPVPGHHVTAYKTLLELRNAGKIRGVGVSNYAWEDYLELKNDKDIAAEDLPLVNQIEINPFLYRKTTISNFQQDGVVLQSYRSLRDGKAMDHPTLTELARKYNKTPAQILGRWCIQHGFVYTPKSVQLHRMRENAAVLDFALANDDLNRLDQLTTTDALETFQNLYRKCVNRDTSRDGTLDGVKMDITVD
jgi:diketogulonate reductase-like aldo/keto reductase